ncbi:MAG: hypothetical protein LC689_14150 [Myxococcales bacterium]|nr:hypothetical protein [Myxococcales bacterium]
MKKSALLLAAVLGCSGSGGAPATALPPIAKPAIGDFHASPNEVAAGGNTTLSWTVTGATSLSVDHGVGDVTGLTQKVVAVAADAIYTLTAANDGGSVTKTVAVATHPAGIRLTYTDPTVNGKIVVTRNADLSVPNEVVLDVKVGSSAVTAFSFAINLPLDATGAAMVMLPGNIGATALGVPGLATNGVINAGSSPMTATALLGTAGSPMQNVLSVGVARNKAAAGTSGDDTWAAGATLFSIALKMNGAAAAGSTMFAAAAATADRRYKAAAIAHDGSTVLSSSDVAIGDLVISQ